jgi:uncharacterized repeat protein (TIGR01451 family)
VGESQAREFRTVFWALAGLLVLALALKSGLLLLMAFLLGLTALATYLWGRFLFERLEYRRTFSRPRCFVGEEVELTVELTNRKLLPVTYLTVTDMVPDELQIASRKLQFARKGTGLLELIFGLTWYEKVIRHYRVTPVRRGFYQLGPATLQGGDPFGYVKQERQMTEPSTLIVYPRIVPLERLGIPTRRPFGDLKSQNRLFEDPMRFAGVREYQQGDPLSRVHWKASAASGRLQVKLLDPSANFGLAVFLNTWAHERSWEGSEMESLETGCSLAASIVHWAHEEGLPVGLYANGLVAGWGFSLRLPPARGPQVLPQALEGLARVGLPSRDSLGEMLTNEAPGLGYGSSVVVITRTVSEEAAGAILKVHRSGRPVTLVLTGTGTSDGDLPRLPGVRVYSVPGEEALHAAVLA